MLAERYLRQSEDPGFALQIEDMLRSYKANEGVQFDLNVHLGTQSLKRLKEGKKNERVRKREIEPEKEKEKQ